MSLFTTGKQGLISEFLMGEGSSISLFLFQHSEVAFLLVLLRKIGKRC